MVNRLFGNNIEPACEYCSYGKKSQNDMILCSKLGITQPSYCCKKFDYDPLKRVPRRVNHRLPKYSPEDFKI